MPVINYYKAEEYHQKYLDKNPFGYCHIGKDKFDEAAKANKTDDLVEIIESLYCDRKTTSAMLEQLEMNIDEVRSILEL